MLRLAPALAGILLSQLLAAFGYDPALPAQPATAIAALRLVMVAMPGVALILVGICLWLYPIPGLKVRDLEDALPRLGDPR